MAKYDDLKRMREQNAPDRTPTAVVVTGMPETTPVEAAPVETPPAEPKAEEPKPVETAPVETKPAETKSDETPAFEVEIDGQKVTISDPQLIAAFQQADKIKKSSEAAAERAALKEEITAELKAAQPQGKSPAELAAEAALAAAEAMKMPDEQLMIDNPKEWQAQLKLYMETQAKAIRESTKAEMIAEQSTAQTKFNEARDAQIAASLRTEFYDTYPVFKGSESIVDKIQAEKVEEIKKSGAASKPLTVAQAKALKDEAFADIAAKATREIVKVQQVGKKLVPPTPPPAVVTSTPTGGQKPPVETAPSPKLKYPPGSLSAKLAERKASRDSAGA